MARLIRYADEKAAVVPQRTQQPTIYTDGQLGLAPGQQLLNENTANDSQAQTDFLMRLAQQRMSPASRRSRAQSYQAPVVDGSNAIGSLAKILGPSPEEVAAEEEQARQHKAKMQGWAGLFNGLRHLGNLYYTTRGATPQQYRTDPSLAIEQNYQQERERLARQRAEQRKYFTDLWNMERQAESDRRRDELHKAQVDWYGTRDEVARMKAENDKLKTEKFVELQDGRIAKVNAETGQIESLLPLKKGEIQSRINKNNRQAANVGVSKPVQATETVVTESIDPATGAKTRTTTRRAAGSGRSSTSSSVPSRRQGRPQQTDKKPAKKISTGVDWKKKK